MAMERLGFDLVQGRMIRWLLIAAFGLLLGPQDYLTLTDTGAPTITAFPQ